MTNLFIPKGPRRYKHQRDGLHAIIKSRGVHALLFDPGVGKTATTLDYIALLALKSDRPIHVLVAAPLAALDTWVIQAETYLPDSIDVWAEVVGGSVRQRAQTLAARGGRPFRSVKPGRGETLDSLGWRKSPEIYLRSRAGSRKIDGPAGLTGPAVILESLSLSSFSQRASVSKGGSVLISDVLHEGVLRFAPDLVVVDESHLIKSAGSNVSRSLHRLSSHVPRRIILTGTVMPNSPLDVYGQWRFLAPDDFGTNFQRFSKRYADWGGFQGRQALRYRNLDELRTILAKRSTVALKDEVLDLPPTTDVRVPVHLSATEAAEYKHIKDALKKARKEGKLPPAGLNRLTQILKLRQIASGFTTDAAGQIVPLGDSRVKVIKSLVHDSLAGEKRVVIFAFFTEEIQRLTKALQQPGTTVEVVTGETSQESRSAIRKRFGSDSPDRIVLIAQSGTLALSVNELVTASHAIFASLTLQRSDFIQSRDRLDRTGQTKPVTFWNVVGVGTLDESILHSHRAKTDLEEAMLQHILDTASDEG